jgi:hypothetical protein
MLSIIPKAALTMHVLITLGLFSGWSNPETMVNDAFTPKELAAAPPRLLSGFKFLFFAQIFTTGLGSFVPAAYLVFTDKAPELGFLIGVVFAFGFMVSEYLYPWPMPDEGFAFVGTKLKIDAVFIIRLTMIVMYSTASIIAIMAKNNKKKDKTKSK